MSKRSGLSNELRPSPFDFLNRHWESDCECSSAHDHFKHEEPKPTSLHMAMLSGICSQDAGTRSKNKRLLPRRFLTAVHGSLV
jgi:hypothetical protein